MGWWAPGGLGLNPQDTCDPLNPSNKGRNPRVADAAHKAIAFPLKAGGAQLYYGNVQPMRTPQQGAPVQATGSVYLNYGMRLERDGRTYFMAWHANPDDPYSQRTTPKGRLFLGRSLPSAG